MKTLRKIFNSRSTFKFALTLVLIVVIFVLFNLYTIASETAETLGDKMGYLSGSVKGITLGIIQGQKDGQEAGINADDYDIEVRNNLKETGILEVLIANAAIHNDFNVGTQYEALYIYKGDAVFTIDLSKTSVTKEAENKIKVFAPYPEVTFVIDEEETEKVMEIQHGYFTGSREGGYDAYITHRNKMDEHLEDNLVSYDSLMTSAKESAILQIISLVKAVCGNDYEVAVEIAAKEVK